MIRIIPERLDYMWFLGYGLDDIIPNHSVLSNARKGWAISFSLHFLAASIESEGKLYVFRRIYSRIVPDYSIEIA